jgi:hypothetical protein
MGPILSVLPVLTPVSLVFAHCTFLACPRAPGTTAMKID